MAVSSVFKRNLTVPHAYEHADDALGFAVSLGTIDTGKFMIDAVLHAFFHEIMLRNIFLLNKVTGKTGGMSITHWKTEKKN